MQIFVPYSSPIKVAQCLDKKRLYKQRIEARQIIDAIKGTGKGWFNHPVVKMYKDNLDWLKLYDGVIRGFIKADLMFKMGSFKYYDALIKGAILNSNMADEIRPPFLTEEFCDQHKRRLYTKDKEFYKDFAKYGESQENWYFIDGKIVKYINGKRL